MLALDVVSPPCIKFLTGRVLYFSFVIPLTLSLYVILFIPNGLASKTKIVPTDEIVVVDFDQIKQHRKPDFESSWRSCNIYDCFDLYQCEYTVQQKVKIYVYPPLTFLDKNGSTLYSSRTHMSKEYWRLLETIIGSEHYEPDSKLACVYVPSIDTSDLLYLNEELNLTYRDVSLLLWSLPYWNQVDRNRPGLNHMIVTMRPDDLQIQNKSLFDFNIGFAFFASSFLNTWSHRSYFDLPTPLSSLHSLEMVRSLRGNQPTPINEGDRTWTLMVTQYERLRHDIISKVDNMELDFDGELLVLGNNCPQQILFSDTPDVNSAVNLLCSSGERGTCRCTKDGIVEFSYPLILDQSSYCLLLPTASPYGPYPELGDYLERGCVPVIAIDEIVLPFPNDIPWDEIVVKLPEQRLNDLKYVIESIDNSTYSSMQSEGNLAWKMYFSSMKNIGQGIMRNLNRLVYPEQLNTNHCDDV